MIRMTWMSKFPNKDLYEQSQIASYAHRMARHAALHCNRELGSAVRLPGSAFRKRKDGTTYVQPGTIARPLSWDEMDEWLSLEHQHDASSGVNTDGSMDFSDDIEMHSLEADGPATRHLGTDLPLVEGLDVMEVLDIEQPAPQHLVVAADPEDERRNELFSRLGPSLHDRTREIIRRLLAGETLLDIQEALDVSQAIITRDIRKAATLVPELLSSLIHPA